MMQSNPFPTRWHDELQIDCVHLIGHFTTVYFTECVQCAPTTDVISREKYMFFLSFPSFLRVACLRDHVSCHLNRQGRTEQVIRVLVVARVLEVASAIDPGVRDLDHLLFSGYTPYCN